MGMRPRVVVIGAGIVGAACAYHLAREKRYDVALVDRGPVAAGTTSRGEGNILVSDKAPGPELDLARYSLEMWRELGARLGDDRLERESKGGLVVATGPEAAAGLTAFAAAQADAGVRCDPVPAGRLRDLEPHLAPGLPGGVHYPDDQQVQPALAASEIARAAAGLGARLLPFHEAVALRTDAGGAVAGLRCRRRGAGSSDARGGGGDVPAGDDVILGADAIVNAAGTWGGDVAHLLGAPIPVLPRRGFVLVTEPLPRLVRHKVYTADYVANVASADEGLETSVVVEGTRGGTVLIGASRERVGYDLSIRYDVVARLAAAAVALFPVLAGVNLMRVYRGFRPYCPDHLPVIGPDPRVLGVWHACGHEGAGIGLAPATGALITAMLAGRDPEVDPAPFSPARFTPDEAPTDTGGRS